MAHPSFRRLMCAEAHKAARRNWGRGRKGRVKKRTPVTSLRGLPARTLRQMWRGFGQMVEFMDKAAQARGL